METKSCSRVNRSKKLVDSIHVVCKVGAILNVGPQKTFRFWWPKVLAGIITFLSFPITLSLLRSGFFGILNMHLTFQ